ncbi:MAG: peptidoglycan-binding protein [Rhodobacteraceae bacterium]|nr:peptidoglycan-binding protein [Paracoccaceae bacterium]
MDRISQLADQIIAREGGYSNDPDDPGGATKFGVTIGTLRRLGLDLNGDRQIDARDVRRVSRARAREIFIEQFFHWPRVSALPEVLQPSVFDMYVNAGSNAVRILQRLLNRMDHGLVVDGVIGPQTVAAAKAAARAAPDHLADAYGIARRNYYYALADARPASRKYVRRRDGGKGGWILRAEDFISARYHLSAAEHARRIAAWA